LIEEAITPEPGDHSGASERLDGGYAQNHGNSERHNLVVVEDACQSLGSSIESSDRVKCEVLMLSRKSRSEKWRCVGPDRMLGFYPFKILGGYGDGAPLRPMTRRWQSLPGGCAITVRIGIPVNITDMLYCLLDNSRRRFWM